MSDLIRGGQVTLHKFRMFMQVLKILFRISIFIFLISTILNFTMSLTSKEQDIGLSWLKKELSFDEDKITYTNKNGASKTVKAKDLEKDLYVRDTIKKIEVTFYKSLRVTGVLSLIAVLGVIVFFCVRGKFLKETQRLRGVFLVPSKVLSNLLKRNNKPFKDYKPFKIADFEYPISGRPKSWSAGEQSHTIILGSTGAGKTKVIQSLVSQLRDRKQKSIIIDIKGDYIKSFYQPDKGDIILNPLDRRGSNWSIFRETNPLKGFTTIAKSLLPKDSKSDPMWTEAARGVLAEMASLYATKGLSLNEFANIILKSDLTTLQSLLEKSTVSKIINVGIEKAALSVLMILSTYLRPLKLYRSNENCFSITDWVKDDTKNNFLFISSNAEVKRDINPLVATQVDIAINALCSLKEESNKPKIWFILDELPYFDQAITNLKDGLTTARSYGGCFVLGTQDMSSLAEIYSEKIASVIANNCTTKVFMRVTDNYTTNWCSNSLGEGEIEEWNEGISYGSHEVRDGIQVNRGKTVKKTVLPAELSMLDTGSGYIKFVGFEPAFFKTKNNYIKKIANSYEENTELLNIFEKEIEENEKRREEIERKLNDTDADSTSNLKVEQSKTDKVEGNKITDGSVKILHKTEMNGDW